jgi:hypothetical protein
VTDEVGWAEENRGARSRDVDRGGIYKQERQRRMLRVPLARDGAKVCVGVVPSVWEWHSAENDIVLVTLHAVHPAGREACT